MVIKIKNANIIFENEIIKRDMFIKGNIISFQDNNEYFDNIIDANQCFISPGFIDIHIHGGNGYDFIDGTAKAYEEIAKFHLKHGTTMMTPTILSASAEEVINSLKAYNKVKNTKLGKNFAGIHMEGPYFAYSQRGAQDSKHFLELKNKDYEKFYAVCNDIVRWSAAPELKGIEEFAAFCNERNIILSVGHTEAFYDDIVKARNLNFRMFTHLYSGMNGVIRKNCFRYCGAVESAFLFDDMYTETISDLVHLPKELLKLVYKIKGSSKNILITDAMRGAGQSEGYSILGSKVNGQKILIEDGVAKLLDRSSFAGSIATSDILLKSAVKSDIPVTDAVKMMTKTPARLLGLKDIGEIKERYIADLVVFDKDINIINVIKNGEII